MDNLRVFSTFQSTSKTFKGRGRGSSKMSKKEKMKTMPRDQNGMVERSLDGKTSVSRSEILTKLEKSQNPQGAGQNKVKGQRFGDGFMAEPSVGDIKKNNPNDPMTTEKLKTMLNSGAVNFNGKEKAILSKILGK